MQRIASLAKIEWITSGVIPPIERVDGQPWSGTTVSNCVPPVFSAYAKVLHPIYEDLTIEDSTLSWDDVDKGRRSPSDLVEELKQSAKLVYVTPDGQRPLRRVRWAELAQRYGLQYTPELMAETFTRIFPGASWPRHLFGPTEGSLDEEMRDALVEILKDRTESGDCYFHFWFMATRELEQDLLYRGPIGEVRLFPDSIPDVRLTPTHWFPVERTWLVCTDYDLCFTLVGGPDELVDVLLDSSTLECVRVEPDTRIDNYGDVANVPTE